MRNILKVLTPPVVVVLLVASAARPARSASPALKGIACRSVHLQYRAPQATAFYNEVTVSESQRGTYFCVCGFNMGYYGLQELGDGRKVLIFSVWDPGKQNDPNAVADADRVKLLKRGGGVRIGRFGNEGTGGQSFYDYDWQVGKTYRFLVTAEVRDRRTAFSAYFYLPEEKQWKHLATFERETAGRPLSGYYAFVEDFRRNRISARQTRTAQFGQAWVRNLEKVWTPVVEARFTADGNPVMNINAGRSDTRFFLSTGGEITNKDTPLKEMILLEQSVGAKPPADLPVP